MKIYYLQFNCLLDLNLINLDLFRLRRPTPAFAGAIFNYLVKTCPRESGEQAKRSAIVEKNP
jgi:hypothetical protein